MRQAAGAAWLETREELTDLIAIELILPTSRRSRAGQFLLTPMAAQDLVDGSVSTSDYFVRNVQF